MERWKIIDVLYKLAVVALLTIVAVLLNDIRKHQAPTIGEYRNAGISGPDRAGAKGRLNDNIPIVRVVGGEHPGGQLSAEQYFTVENAIQVKPER